MNNFSTNVTLMKRNLAIESGLRPASRPFVLNHGHKLRSIPINSSDK
jgi:hypothetical protein